MKLSSPALVGLCPEAKGSRQQTAEHQNGQRKPRASPSPHGSRQRCCTQEGDLVFVPITSNCASAWDTRKRLWRLSHRILVIISHLLKEQPPYRELGPDQAEEKATESAKRRALRTLEHLGYDVTLQSVEVA